MSIIGPCLEKTIISGKTVCHNPTNEANQIKVTPKNDNFADLEPVFLKEVSFPPPSTSIFDSCVLRLLIYNIDVNRKHKIIGQVLLPLENIDLSQGKLNLNADIDKSSTACLLDKKEILISLSYNPTLSRLTVNVMECKGITSLCFNEKSSDPPDVFVKVSLMHHAKELKAKKTAICKKSYNPVFQESLIFRLDNRIVDNCGVKINVIQHLHFPEKNKNLGIVVLGGFMFARGKGKEHWDEIQKFQKEFIQMWHPILCP